MFRFLFLECVRPSLRLHSPRPLSSDAGSLCRGLVPSIMNLGFATSTEKLIISVSDHRFSLSIFERQNGSSRERTPLEISNSAFVLPPRLLSLLIRISLSCSQHDPAGSPFPVLSSSLMELPSWCCAFPILLQQSSAYFFRFLDISCEDFSPEPVIHLPPPPPPFLWLIRLSLIDDPRGGFLQPDLVPGFHKPLKPSIWVLPCFWQHEITTSKAPIFPWPLFLAV